MKVNGQTFPARQGDTVNDETLIDHESQSRVCVCVCVVCVCWGGGGHCGGRDPLSCPVHRVPLYFNKKYFPSTPIPSDSFPSVNLMFLHSGVALTL